MSKKFTIVLVISILMVGFSAVADASVSAVCTLKSEGNLLEDKTLNVVITSKTVSFTASALGKVSGSYVGVARNGASMYDGSDLADLIDQSDLAYIFVSPALAKGRNGSLGLSVRQLGDSEGAWWINDTYSCKVVR
jgi:hypothetical protein